MTATYIINPNFRLVTPNLKVEWHRLDRPTLAARAAGVDPAAVFTFRRTPQIIVRRSGPVVQIAYHDATDFAARGIQKWLRSQLRDIIYDIARQILPQRVRYWEQKKQLFGSGVKIERLRKTALACCSADNEITLQPFLVLFKQEWIDEIILHEIAHYRHKHHRRQFWKFLTQLLGQDARAAKARKDIELSPYYAYCLYLTAR